jgi:cation diffusion facilitator family transporter
LWKTWEHLSRQSNAGRGNAVLPAPTCRLANGSSAAPARPIQSYLASFAASARVTNHELSAWTHPHRFNALKPVAERRTRAVLWITLVAMVAEIVAGTAYNSMALLADGWHMSSHVLAIGLSVLAYALARRYADDGRFAFGTWKIEVLGGYTSALLLIGVALAMVIASTERLLDPTPIRYREAFVVAVLGLIVNLVCAAVLAGKHEHTHGHGHEHPGHAHHGGEQGDLNLEAAYIHVLADAATSVLALIALLGGWFLGWAWLDPLMGIVGALLVASWAKGLIAQTGAVLLDREMDHPVVAEIREVIAAFAVEGQTRITDLHVWRVGQGAYACTVSLVTHDPLLTPSAVREQLGVHEELVHVTVEIERCCTESADTK